MVEQIELGVDTELTAAAQNCVTLSHDLAIVGGLLAAGEQVIR
jgi:hypothetical protein